MNLIAKTGLLRRTVMCALLLWGVRAHADLDSYLRRPEPAYKWEKLSEQPAAGGTITDLHLVSQTWQGITWEHRLVIYRPEKPKYAHFCALLNVGGSGGKSPDPLGLILAKGLDSPLAILYNIPNQPLYDGRKEDALVVYTWLKYMETGDETWPLHFPMAKAVLKAMDAIQEFTRQNGQPEITDFMITGASKRGWTTWLAAASRDKRIKAIAPMVIDTLNLPAQSKHVVEAYGKPSEQIEDYTNAHIAEKLLTPAGKRLIALEDPYSYRDRLTLPKLIVNGTNDRYWTQDALNFYWDDLKGPKWVLYVPNSGHGLEDFPRAVNSIVAFGRAIASKTAMPRLTWNYHETDKAVELTVSGDQMPKSARLFHVSALTQDFRDAKWTSEELKGESNGSHTAFHVSFPRPETGYSAVFGEVSFEIDGKPFTLSTQIHILPSVPAAENGK